MSAEVPTTVEVAVAARLAASWWSRPLPEETARWATAWPDAAAVAAALGIDPELVDELADAAHAAGADELLDAYERLFVGPGRTPCPPYESLWRDGQPRLEQGRLMGAASAEVVELYRALGLSVSAARELPDHVAVEWEALAYGVEQSSPESEEVAAALLREHLALWLPRLCAAVEAEEGDGFYGLLARLTSRWVAALAEAGPAP